jgi:hypothetical protein
MQHQFDSRCRPNLIAPRSRKDDSRDFSVPTGALRRACPRRSSGFRLHAVFDNADYPSGVRHASTPRSSASFTRDEFLTLSARKMPLEKNGCRYSAVATGRCKGGHRNCSDCVLPSLRLRVTRTGFTPVCQQTRVEDAFNSGSAQWQFETNIWLLRSCERRWRKGRSNSRRLQTCGELGPRRSVGTTSFARCSATPMRTIAPALKLR